MEIKVGDKVRVSKDAPMIYIGGIYAMFIDAESIVKVTEDDNAIIQAKNMSCLTIPTKYLIKVDAEAKEAKFKKGDKVRFKKIYTVVSVDDGQVFIDSAGNHIDEDCLELYTEPTAPTIKVGDRVCCYNALHLKGSKKEDYMGYVTSITDMGITIQLDKGGLVLVYHESDLELVQPKEQTEETSPNVNHSDIDIDTIVARGYISDPKSFFKCDWDAYAADLAKEIALKVANKYSDPIKAAEYAVSVAKAVVENLNKK